MILVTGFEPFGSDTENPSRLAARTAVDLLVDGGEEAVFLEVPCEFARAGETVLARARELGATVVVCAGVAAGRGVLSLERLAVNLIDARIPDNAGVAPIDEPVSAGGVLALGTRLPVKRALSALRAIGVPAELSMTAGTYVCNSLFYEVLAGLETTVTAGFVHVPPLEHLDLETQARGLAAVALEAARGGADARARAGSEY